MALFPTNATQVQQFAGALYGVQVGSVTLAQVTSDIQAAGGLNNALNSYYASSFGSSTTASVAATVAANLGLTGTAATDGAAYIKGQLDAAPAAGRGAVIANILNLFSNLTSDATYGAAATAWNTKVAAAATYAGAANVTIGTVVAVPFVLTKGVDTFTGGAGDDLFTADGSGTDKMLSAADKIVGGAGNDTLNVFNAAADAIDGLSFAGVSGVENVYINNGTLTDGTTLDTTTITGLTSIEVAAPVAILDTKAFTVKTLATQTPTLTKVNVAATKAGTLKLDGSTSVNLNAAGASTTDSGTLTVDLISIGASLAVNTTGAASKVTLANTGAALTSVTVTGDQGLTLTESLDALKTINASAATGKIAVDASGATVAAGFAFTGGTAADTLTLKAGALALLTSAAQLDGGAGADTLVLKETAVLTSAQVKAVNTAKNFETLGFGASGSGADVSTLTSVTAFKVLKGNFSETFTNSAAANTYLIDNASGNSGTVTVTNKVGETATTITVDNGAGSSKTLAKIDVTGISNVSLTSTGVTTKAGGANVLTEIANSDNSSIVIKGDTDLTITNAVAATAIGSKVDASALTGKLVVKGSGKGDVIIGGSNNDTITGGDGTDTATGGAGADTFAFAAADGAGADGAAVADIITDFVAGTDKLQFTGMTDVVSGQQTAVQTAVTALAAGSTAAQIATAMANANTTDVGVAFAVFEGNTYVYVEKVGATTTHIEADNLFIKLSGVTTVPTFTGDVVA